MANKELFDGEVITTLENDDNIAVQKANPSIEGSKVISWTSFKTFLQGFFVSLENVAQTILGTKTFSSSPNVPDPTSNLHAVNLRTLNNKVGTQGLQLIFDAASNIAADPGTGYLRYNSLTQSSATKLYINSNEYDSGTLNGILTILKDGSVITIKQKGDRTKYVSFSVVSVVDNSGWFTIDVSLLVKGTDFEDDDVLNVFFVNDRGVLTSDISYLVSSEDESITEIKTLQSEANTEFAANIKSIKNVLANVVASVSGQIQQDPTTEPLILNTTPQKWSIDIVQDSTDTNILEFDTTNDVLIYKQPGRYAFNAKTTLRNLSTSTDHTVTVTAYDASDDSVIGTPRTIPVPKNTTVAITVESLVLQTVLEEDVPFSAYVMFSSTATSTNVLLDDYQLIVSAVSTLQGSGLSSIAEDSIADIRALINYSDGSDVFLNTNGYLYEYDSTETGADDGINILIPDDNTTGTGAFVLKAKYLQYEVSDGLTYARKDGQWKSLDGVTTGTISTEGGSFDIDFDTINNALINIASTITTSAILNFSSTLSAQQKTVPIYLKNNSTGEISVTINADVFESGLGETLLIPAGSIIRLYATVINGVVFAGLYDINVSTTDTINASDLEPYSDTNVETDGFLGYRANRYVSYVNAASTDTQFQTEAIYRSDYDIAQGVSPEDDTTGWVYLGTSTVISSSSLAKITVYDLTALKALASPQNGQSIIVETKSYIYKFNSTITSGVLADDGTAGSWNPAIPYTGWNLLLAIKSDHNDDTSVIWPQGFVVLVLTSNEISFDVENPDTGDGEYTMTISGPCKITRSGSGFTSNDFTIEYFAKQYEGDTIALADTGTVSADMSKNLKVDTYSIADGATTFTITPSNLVFGNQRKIILDNSYNTSAISSIVLDTVSSTITWSWMNGDDITGGFSAGTINYIILECLSSSKIRLYWEDEA